MRSMVIEFVTIYFRETVSSHQVYVAIPEYNSAIWSKYFVVLGCFYPRMEVHSFTMVGCASEAKISLPQPIGGELTDPKANDHNLHELTHKIRETCPSPREEFS